MKRLNLVYIYCSRLIIGLCINIYSASSQNTYESFGDTLMYKYQDSSYALKEYLRAYHLDKDNISGNLISKIVKLYTTQGHNEKALQYLDVKYFISKSISEKNSTLEEKILLYLNSGNADMALVNAFQLYETDQTSRDTKNFYLGYCFLLKNEFDQGLKHLYTLTYLTKEDSLKLELLTTELKKINKANPNRAIFYSALFPGLGQTIYGDYKDGLKSLGLIAGLLLLMIDTANVLSFTDALISVGPWITRYEIGGMVNAKKRALEHLKKKKNNTMRKIIHVITESKLSQSSHD